MKTLILMLLMGSITHAQVIGTYHKTPNGKYPHFYKEKAEDTPWDDADQEKYDDAMDEAIHQVCVDSVAVKRAQAVLAHEKAVGKATGTVDMTAIHDAGSVLVNLKASIEPLAKIIHDETGKDVSTYECE